MCDLKNRNSHGDSSAGIDTLSKFSLYTNALNLLKVKSTANKDLSAIHGIRCICCLMVIYIHRFEASAFAKQDEITIMDILRVRIIRRD